MFKVCNRQQQRRKPESGQGFWQGFFLDPPPSKGMDLVFSAETQAIKKLVIETGLGCLSWPQPKLLKVEKEIASRNSQI